MGFERLARSIPARYLVVLLVALLALDSMLKEIEVLPDSIRKAGFYFLPPLVVVGTLLLFPYTRARLAIVTPKFLTRSLQIAMIGISVFAAIMLATIYVQQAPYGEMDVGALNSAAKLVKGATLKVVPGAPHGMCQTLKDQINAELLAFFKQSKESAA